MIDTVVFDIGQVLAEFRWKGYIEDLGIKGDEAERLAKVSVLTPYWDEVDRGTMTIREIMEYGIKKDADIEESIRRFYADRRSLVTEFDYSEDLVKGLKDEGYKVYILSNYGEENFVYAKQYFRFLKYVDGMVISYEIKHIKPEPEIYEELIKRYGVNPETSVFLDDRQINLDGAKQFGFKTILFDDRDRALTELRDMLAKR